MSEKVKLSFWERVLPPLITGIIIFGGWELIVRIFNISTLVVPAPTTIIAETIRWFPIDIYPQFLMTLKVAGCGVLIAAPLGVLLATLVAQSKLAIKMSTPLVVTLLTMPMVVLAPILMIILGTGQGFGLRLIIVVLQAVPVVMINTMHGFQKVTKSNMELARIYGMNRLNTIIKIQFPSALPEVFVGVKLSCIFSLLATIGGEFVIGNIGLGYWIQHCIQILATPIAFGSIVMVAVIGTVLQNLVNLLEKLVIKYR